jgi:hypothetical protein
MGGGCSMHGSEKKRITLVVKSKEKRQLEELTDRWEDNIKIDIKEIGF